MSAAAATSAEKALGLAEVRQNIAAGVNVDGFRSGDLWTALMVSAAQGYDGVVRQGQLQAARAEKALYEAAWAVNLAEVRRHIAAGVNVDGFRDTDGWTALIVNALQGYDGVVEELLAGGADVNARSKRGRTALYRAAGGGYTGCVGRLLSAGADVTMRDSNGWTTLHGAALGGHDECVQLLLDAGVEVGAKDKDGETALYKAAEEGHAACVRLLLAAGGGGEAATVDEKESENGWTALMAAAYGRHPDCVDLLLEAGAAVNVVGNDGYTALSCGAGRPLRLVRALCRAGANLSVVNKTGRTALGEASHRGHTRVADMLKAGTYEERSGEGRRVRVVQSECCSSVRDALRS